MKKDNEYAVFNRQKLYNYLTDAFAKKTDFQWASLLGGIIGVGFAIYIATPSTGSPWSTLDVTKLVFLYLLLFVSISLFLRSAKKYAENHKFTSSKLNDGLSSIEVSHDHTAVLIAKKCFTNEPKILVTKDPQWGYMLPYVKINATEYEGDDIEQEFKSQFNNMLKGSDGVVMPLSGYQLSNVVKQNPHKGNAVGRFTFSFFELCHARYMNAKRILKVLQTSESRDYTWETLETIANDPLSMRNNAEIINRLREDNMFYSLPESFAETPESWEGLPEGLRVIWNITEACEYKCEFCATDRKNKGRSNSTPPFEFNVNVAQELLKIPGVSIDIAGGDPLADKNSRKSIFHILKYMSNDNITITSTGKAFASLEKHEQDELVALCEDYDVSYDFPSTWPEPIYRSSDYNKNNLKQLKDFRARGIDATVLITLSPQNTRSIDTIKAMIKELDTEVDPQKITLLRLMPVGKQEYSNYPSSPEEYDPFPAIKLFQEKFGSRIKLHCAFRSNNGEGRCNMLTEKIGIDHNGNVFACAWAGYLDFSDVTKNPFYLGNVDTIGGIRNVFKSKEYSNLQSIVNKNTHGGCPIFSYLAHNSLDTSTNNDPLYKCANPEGPQIINTKTRRHV